MHKYLCVCIQIKRLHAGLLLGEGNLAKRVNRILFLQPPGELIPVRCHDRFQVAVIVCGAKFTEDQRAGWTPIPVKMIHQRFQKLEIAVEMIIIEICQVRSGPIRLTGAAVIAHQDIAGAIPHDCV